MKIPRVVSMVLSILVLNAELGKQDLPRACELRPLATYRCKHSRPKTFFKKTASYHTNPYRINPEQSDPYHPDNILATFKKGKISWKSIPKEYLKADIEVLVNELAGLLDKDPGKLNTTDYEKRVFIMDTGEKKSLFGLVDFIMRSYKKILRARQAVSKIKNMLKIKGERVKKYHLKYHPDNILDTFKKGKISWKSIPEEYLKADIEVFVNELAKLLDKDPGELNTTDYGKRVFTLYSGEKRSIYGLLYFIRRRYKLLKEKEALLRIRKILGIKRYKNPKYHPDNILATFKKGKLFWKSIPEEYLKADIEVLVNELAGLLHKDSADLKLTPDFFEKVFVMDSGEKKSLCYPPVFIGRKYGLSKAEAVSKIEELLGIKQKLWRSNNWREVKRLLRTNMTKEQLSQIKTKQALNAYLYSYRLTKDEESSLADLMNKGRGNKAALSALIYSHYQEIEAYVGYAIKRYSASGFKLDPGGLMEYIINRLNKASLSFDPEKSSYAIFISRVMESARYDYMRLLSGERRKTKAKVGRYPQSREEAQFEDILIQPKKELYQPENEHIVEEVLMALGFSRRRDREIFIDVKLKSKTQRMVAYERGLSSSIINLYVKEMKASLARYEDMIRKVIEGEWTLDFLLTRIRDSQIGEDGADRVSPAKENSLSLTLASQA